MDFAKLDIGVAAPVRQETAFDVEFPQFKNGNGKALSVTLLAFTSPEGQKELRKWQMRHKRLTEDHSGATEEELDELAEQAKSGDAELIARVVRSWNLEGSDGKAIACTLENRVGFLVAYPPVANALAAKVADLVSDLGKSSAASASGRRKKAS